MTISSYPWLKLLISIISAIVVCILVSWVWGIGTFFILMFIFIWVAEWIFEVHTTGKVKVTYEMEELLDKLEIIGNIKNALPLNARGWCNSLGLYVQLKAKGGLSRLQAGDNKKRSQIDAWQGYSSTEWKVQKYNRGDWQKLVDPTLDIANWLSTYRGLPAEYTDSFKRAIREFKKEGHLKLPPSAMETGLGANEPSKHDIIEEILISEDSELPRRQGKVPITNFEGLGDEVETVDIIEEYDFNLLEDIQRLENHISEAELLQKDFMRASGAPDRVIEDVVKKARDEGSPISFDGSGKTLFHMLGFLREMVPIYKNFAFRAWHPMVHSQGFGMNMLTRDGWYKFNTCPLNDDERREYAKHEKTTHMQSYSLKCVPIIRGYPDIKFMGFIADMLMKYESAYILTKDYYYDEKMISILDELYS